jgi:malate dehydrogenase
MEDKPANDISAMVIGGHGDTTMIPLTHVCIIMEYQFSILSEEALQKLLLIPWW